MPLVKIGPVSSETGLILVQVLDTDIIGFVRDKYLVPYHRGGKRTIKRRNHKNRKNKQKSRKYRKSSKSRKYRKSRKTKSKKK